MRVRSLDVIKEGTPFHLCCREEFSAFRTLEWFASCKFLHFFVKTWSCAARTSAEFSKLPGQFFFAWFEQFFHEQLHKVSIVFPILKLSSDIGRGFLSLNPAGYQGVAQTGAAFGIFVAPSQSAGSLRCQLQQGVAEFWAIFTMQKLEEPGPNFIDLFTPLALLHHGEDRLKLTELCFLKQSKKSRDVWMFGCWFLQKSIHLATPAIHIIIVVYSVQELIVAKTVRTQIETHKISKEKLLLDRKTMRWFPATSIFCVIIFCNRPLKSNIDQFSGTMQVLEKRQTEALLVEFTVSLCQYTKNKTQQLAETAQWSTFSSGTLLSLRTPSIALHVSILT